MVQYEILKLKYDKDKGRIINLRFRDDIRPDAGTFVLYVLLHNLDNSHDSAVDFSLIDLNAMAPVQLDDVDSTFYCRVVSLKEDVAKCSF